MIAVFGQFRSGTHYTQQLIDKNFENSAGLIEMMKEEEIIYQHGAHDVWNTTIPDGMDILIVYKSPRKWVDSLIRQSYDFVQCYNVHHESGHTPVYLSFNYAGFPYGGKIKCSLEKVCAVYNRYFDYWMTQRVRPVRMVSHRDVTFRPIEFLNMIEREYGLTRKRTPFELVTPNEVVNSRPFTSKVMSYYLDTEKTENLTTEQLSVIDSIIDKKILRELFNGC